MNKYTLAISITFLSLTQVIGQPAGISDTLKSNIQVRVDNGDIIGLVIGTIDGDQTSYHSTGVGSLMTKAKVDENSVFEIGSISKTFTGLMLADMVTQGKMKLTDDIQQYLPKGITAPTRDGQSIKLYHLSNHTSGLPRMPSNFAPADNLNPFADYSTELMYQFLDDYELTRDIGSQYEYSNFAQGLLGSILAAQNNMSYEELLISSIAKPLSMNQTSTTGQESVAYGHMGSTEMPNWGFGSLEGAGAIRSTAADMIRYLSANMGLTESDLYPAMQLAHKNSGAADSNPIVGLGWHHMMHEGKEIIWHNGETGGYHSFTGWIKGTNKGVVVLNNSKENIDDIGLNALVSTFPLKQVKKTMEVSEDILESYVGKYALAPTFILTVTKADKQLSVQATGQGNFEIYPESETTFFYKVVDAKVVFKKGGDGKIESLTLFQGGQEILGKRME